jgi:hypothetical protein
LVSEKKRFETFFPKGSMLNKSCRSRHFEFHIRTKNVKFVEDHPMNMMIGRSSVFYADRKSKMAATTDHSINTGPYRENTEISSLSKWFQRRSILKHFSHRVQC